MLFLTDREQREWRSRADEILAKSQPPQRYDTVRPELVPAFHFYLATFLAAHGKGELAGAWARAGVLEEEDGLFGLAFLASFFERYGNRLIKPARVFADPRPFIHFASVPLLSNARKNFIRHCGESLPVFGHPVRFMDIGCGNGALAVAVLTCLLEHKKIPGISEILLIDPSPAMVNLAEETIHAAFPDIPIRIESCTVQDCSQRIGGTVDIAMSSLAYHHMPLEEKRVHLARLKPCIDHFLLFEMGANNDTPGLYSPALALSVYQSYGRIFDDIFAHDGPLDVVTASIDAFLMTEVVSILTEPRGERSDYHMLQCQWNRLLAEVLSPEFVLLCDSVCHADDHVSLFTLHYGRT